MMYMYDRANISEAGRILRLGVAVAKSSSSLKRYSPFKRKWKMAH